MIKTEYYMTRHDGVVLNRTWSDLGLMIERDGAQYSEAIDPAELGRVYTEVEPADLDGEAETADYLAALNKLGVSQ